MEYTPATNGNGCWCLVHIEWIFFESSTRESSDNQDLAILWPRDLRHLPHPGEGELHFLLPPSPGFRAAQVWLSLNIYRFPALCSHWWSSSLPPHLGEQLWTGTQAVATGRQQQRALCTGVTCSAHLLCVPLIGDYPRLRNLRLQVHWFYWAITYRALIACQTLL